MRAAPSQNPARFPLWAERLLLPLLAAVAAAVAYSGTLRYFFSQDAFTVLARVRGLEPSPAGAWRLISGSLYFRFMDGAFGLDPRPYHVVQLALHAANAALVCWLGRRLGLTRGAALLAAAFFATHLSHLDAMIAVTGIGELLAATFTLMALNWALPAPGHDARWRPWAITLCYVAALLSKETVVLFPAVLWLLRRLEPRAVRGAVGPCAAIGAIYAASFWLSDPFGLRSGGPGGNPYEPVWGAALLHTWSTYLWWAVNVVRLTPENVTDMVLNYAGGWIATLAAAGGLVLLAARAPGAGMPEAARRNAGLLGAALYVAFIAPVLPLATHAYHFYLYLPLVGLAWLGAAVLDALRPPAWRWLYWALAAVVAAHGSLTVRSLEAVRVPDTDLPSLGAARRALVAERALGGLAAGEAPLPSRLLVLGPRVLRSSDEAAPTRFGRYLFESMRVALDEGRGIRLFHPEVRTVAISADLDSARHEADVVVIDYRGFSQRGPVALLWLNRFESRWRAGAVVDAFQALGDAEISAWRWLREVPPGRWRDRGAGGIRERARRLLQALSAPPAADPRASAWPDVMLRLQRLARTGVPD